jgi:hypothetical protein
MKLIMLYHQDGPDGYNILILILVDHRPVDRQPVNHQPVDLLTVGLSTC